ncbi:MAG: sn-glycerol-3-phosphate ABC transporter ATP-binding protein UgpC [Eubacteriales bacterium]
MAHIRLKNINKVYSSNGFHAVHDFSLEIKKGEFIVFVGPSGCGKSTTLRMIAGLEDITAGKLYINDVFANHKTPRDRGVAMVFQSYALYPHLSVYDNMSFGLTLKGIDKDLIEQRVVRTAKILGLTEYLDRKPRELSGGQRQRVAVGRAIIRHVEVFLMDEPLSNLDAKQRVTMRSELLQIHRRIGATTIYVTHDQTEAMTMADRIVVMDKGVIQQIGTPRDLYFRPVNKFVAGFIGEPPMNFIPCTTKDGRLYPDGMRKAIYINEMKEEISSNIDGQSIELGFRPEAAILQKNAKDNQEGIELEVKVLLSELLGDNVNVYAQLGDHKIIIKVSPYDIPEIDSSIKIIIPVSSICLFEAESGKILCNGCEKA